MPTYNDGVGYGGLTGSEKATGVSYTATNTVVMYSKRLKLADIIKARADDSRTALGGGDTLGFLRLPANVIVLTGAVKMHTGDPGANARTAQFGFSGFDPDSLSAAVSIKGDNVMRRFSNVNTPLVDEHIASITFTTAPPSELDIEIFLVVAYLGSPSLNVIDQEARDGHPE